MRALATFTSVVATLLVAAPTALGAAEQPAGAPVSAPAVASTDRLIVQWAPGAGRDERIAARAAADVSLERGLGEPGLQLLEVDDGQAVGDALASLRADDATLVVERDRLSFPQAMPDDSLFGELWGLENPGGALGVAGFLGPLADADIDAIRAWDRTVGTPSTVVAVIDSGYRFNHPDLGPVAWSNADEPVGGGDDDGNGFVDDVRGYDFVGQDANVPVPDNDPSDSDLITGGHGVHVAGTVGAAGDDGLGITGVGQDLRIMPLRVCANHAPSLLPGQTPRSSCPDSALIQAIDYAGENGAAVANISLGRAGSPSQQVIDAFGRNPGTLYVISAGNDGEDNDGGGAPPAGHHYPCDHDPAVESAEPGAIDNIVCVAATDQADQLADFSDFGATSVDLGAPGTEILSAYPTTTRYAETFTANDFAARWTATGPGGGFARSSESPLSSFGMTDTPGVAPAASSTRQSTSTGTTIPAGLGSCKFSQQRDLVLGPGDSYSYAILLNDVTIFDSGPVTISGYRSTIPIAALNLGGTVKIRQTYTTGSSPTDDHGVWLDDFSLLCYEPTSSTTATYSYSQGTSMAAPHVAGAAGLLFSLKPDASVDEVRDALLLSVDPLASLDGLTATGGRLDVADALDDLVPPPDPGEPGDPGGPGDPGNPGGPSAPGPTGTTIAPAPALVVPPALVTSRCRVPKLKGLSRRRAKAALTAAGCALGKVTKPKKRKGRKRLPQLVVRSSTPKAGTELAAGAKVAVKLGPKPKPKKRRRR